MQNRSLESLKTLVTKKLSLEKEGIIKSAEYQTNSQNIEQLLSQVSETEKKYLKMLCKQEYENYVNFYNSDIEPAQQKIMNKKMEVILTCSELLNKKTVKKSFNISLER
jgi:molecular chaperone GrpE (heat shock protein)